MPDYTDPKQEAAWQSYLQPYLQQWNSNAGGSASHAQLRASIAGNTAYMRNQFNNQWAQQQAQDKAKADSDAATNAANANTQQAYGLAGSDLSRVSSNPTDNLIRDQLSAKLTGQVLDPSAVPYDAVTKNAMLVGQGQTAAAAESARNQQLMDSIASNGGSAFDPGVRAALQQSLTQRQDQVSNAQLGIDQQANLANFQAQTNARTTNNSAQLQAAQALQAQNNAQQQRQTGASQNYQNLLEQQRFSTTGGATAAPQANSFQAYQQAMAPKPPAAAPAPPGYKPAATGPVNGYRPITR